MWRKDFFYEHLWQSSEAYYIPSTEGYVSGQYKYMKYFRNFENDKVLFEELYDLEKDANEINNLIDTDPVLKEEMAKVCNRRKVAWSPGCGSLTEISLAEELGAEVVKIFPGSQVGGPGFVKAVRGPFPWTSIMPTGGVEPTEDNLKKWFNLCRHGVKTDHERHFS